MMAQRTEWEYLFVIADWGGEVYEIKGYVAHELESRLVKLSFDELSNWLGE